MLETICHALGFCPDRLTHINLTTLMLCVGPAVAAIPVACRCLWCSVKRKIGRR